MKDDEASIIEPCKKIVKTSGKVNVGKVKVEIKSEPSSQKSQKKSSKEKKPNKKDAKDIERVPETSHFQISLSELVDSGKHLTSAIVQKTAESGPIVSIEVKNEGYCSIQETSVGVLKPLANSMALIPSLISLKFVNNSWMTTYLGIDGMEDISSGLCHTPLLTTIVVRGSRTDCFLCF